MGPIGAGDWVQIISTEPFDAVDFGRVDVVTGIGVDGDFCPRCKSVVGITLSQDPDDGLWCACELKPMRSSKEPIRQEILDWVTRHG